MHVAVVQFDIAWEDKPANHRTMEAMIAEADPPEGAYVLLPELADTGFSFDLDAIVDDRSLAWAAALARSRRVWIQVGHARRGPDGRGRNCMTIVAPDGRAVGTYEKVHPFSYGREVEHFDGGDRVVVRDTGAARVCPLVCYDLRFPEVWRRPVVADPDAAAEVFTIGASWPNTRQSHWRDLLVARAIENQAFVVAANRVGDDPDLSYSGGSIIVSPMGVVLAEADDAPAVLQADLDIEAVRTWRREFPALRDVRPGMLGDFPVEEKEGTVTFFPPEKR
jgi:predicted amidohydrolase